MGDNFYIISCYGKESLEWISNKSIQNYYIYLKDENYQDNISPQRITRIPNVGYNIYSYMKFIVDNYEQLPSIMVFCKNNVFPRHVSQNCFFKLAERSVFTPIEEPSQWQLNYPVSMLSSDNGFLEINNSWYTPHNPLKYFTTFNDFWQFIFSAKNCPRYLRFAPGANYVVPKANVLLRSKAFYQNLMSFVSHNQFSGESHMIERALYSIWNSTYEESEKMSSILSEMELEKLQNNRKPIMSRKERFKNTLFIKMSSMVDSFMNN